MPPSLDIVAGLRRGSRVALRPALQLLVSSSRAILYASNGDDFADAARNAARDLRDAINTVRKP